MAGDAMVRIAMTGRKGALLMSTVLTTFMSMLRCALWLSWSLWVVERYYSYYVQRTNNVGWREVVIGLAVT